ncbi:hypothetical protein SBOR_4594 [Sclerotinia borealis F-4128]|uniref:Acyclic terpene utilisation N-terminal domain-containing protein n=1 Tax=Sclerotinia borealis (strain F-4128) TaxID=1432307 RepID=W9CGR6_SCLBF|nr:hypothetical protein SBOR_4594 [Sclerotinia borealis F-4128]
MKLNYDHSCKCSKADLARPLVPELPNVAFLLGSTPEVNEEPPRLLMFVISLIHSDQELTLFQGDPAYRMYEQLSLGDVDFITGDYLAEMNMAENTEAYRSGKHPGYISTALEGLSQSLELLAEKKTKVIINGGALNPEGLARKVDELAKERGISLNVVIAAAWYWHSWSATDDDSLAGSLIPGHRIECSAYVTGANFSRFTEYDQDVFVDPGFPIAEIEVDGSCTITKHEGTGGNHYLNSDVTAVLDSISVSQVTNNRVKITGIIGLPPPSSTKTAMFYHAGYQCQFLVNATGYGTKEKWSLFERQMKRKLQLTGIEKYFELLEFQTIGVPASNPSTQRSSTTYCRVFAEAHETTTLQCLVKALCEISLQHFSGFHASLDMRTAAPKHFLAYYPALFPQHKLDKQMHIIGRDTQIHSFPCGPSTTIPTINPTLHSTYDTPSPQPLSTFDPTKRIRLADIALARSGDKRANFNCGFFIPTSSNPKLYPWLQNYLSREQIKEMLRAEWEERYVIERVEFPRVLANQPRQRSPHTWRVLLGRQVTDMGEDVSKSSLLKIAGNNCVISFMEVIAEAHVFAEETVVESYSKRLTTGAYAPAATNKVRFDMALAIKDAKYALNCAKNVGAKLQVSEVALENLEAAFKMKRPWIAVLCMRTIRQAAGLDFYTDLCRKRDGLL